MKKKVAFICVHNSCRSQIAEALGKHLASDVYVNFAVFEAQKTQNYTHCKVFILYDN